MFTNILKNAQSILLPNTLPNTRPNTRPNPDLPGIPSNISAITSNISAASIALFSNLSNLSNYFVGPPDAPVTDEPLSSRHQVEDISQQILSPRERLSNIFGKLKENAEFINLWKQINRNLHKPIQVHLPLDTHLSKDHWTGQFSPETCPSTCAERNPLSKHSFKIYVKVEDREEHEIKKTLIFETCNISFSSEHADLSKQAEEDPNMTAKQFALAKERIEYRALHLAKEIADKIDVMIYGDQANGPFPKNFEEYLNTQKLSGHYQALKQKFKNFKEQEKIKNLKRLKQLESAKPGHHRNRSSEDSARTTSHLAIPQFASRSGSNTPSSSPVLNRRNFADSRGVRPLSMESGAMGVLLDQPGSTVGRRRANSTGSPPPRNSSSSNHSWLSNSSPDS